MILRFFPAILVFLLFASNVPGQETVVSVTPESVRAEVCHQIEGPVLSSARVWRPLTAADTLISHITDSVDGSQLMGDIEWLITLGSRYGLGDNINSVGDELRTRLEGFGLATSVHEIEFSGMPSFNIVATKLGTVHPDSFFVVSAHYDATSQDPMNFTPGADDNGSGVATILACAELLEPYATRYSIQFVLFSDEELGLWGSQEWAEDMAAVGFPIIGGVNCDMIGYWTEGVDFDLEVLTNPQSRWIADAVANVAALYTGMPVEIHQAEDYVGSDFRSFWDNGYACLDLKEGFTRGDADYNPAMHTTWDLPEYVSLEMLTGSAKVAIASVATLAVVEGGVSDVAGTPRPIVQLRAYPNPFNAATTILCSAPGPDRSVWLEFFDLRGRRVDGQLLDIRDGEGQVIWRARDCSGVPLPSGTYFFQAKLSSEMVRGRIQLVQ